MATLYQCPVCGNSLDRKQSQYCCSHGHSFDIARQGHVNLLLPSHTGSKTPGDSKEMLQSRREFLEAGYYQQFSDALNEIALRVLSPQATSCLDAGCGEGYYTTRLRKYLENQGNDLDFYGVDVAKKAVQYAAGRDKKIQFAVASTYHLPFRDRSMDGILCVFAPRDEAEFARVLKPEGKLMIAAPGRRHLYSLREQIYSEPGEIGQKGDVSSFTLAERGKVSYTIQLDTTRDILNLLTMTPYSRHTQVEALTRLRGLSRLETEIDINILVYAR